MKSYLRASSLLFNQPLLTTPDMLDTAVRWANQVMNLNIINLPGASMHAKHDVQDAIVSNETRRGGSTVAATGVQVISVHGMLVSRGAHIDPCETMTSYEGLRVQLQQAVADPLVERIVLDIDTPGGSATGAFELASDLRALALQKPITGLVNFSALSGGYLIAAACSEIVVSRTSSVGSIGVIAKHMDRSEALAQQGIKVTTVFAGAHKNDLSPHEPLTEQSMQFLQSIVDDSYSMFVEAIAEYRGLSVQQVRDTEAGLFRGEAAIAAGLADRLETPQKTVDSIAQEVALNRQARSPSSIGVRARAANIAAQI